MGFSIEKVLIIMLLAALLLGPEKLPRMASGLASLVRRVRVFADDTKSRLKDEMGDDFDDIDWRDLDPRQYDPRRIIREALTEPLPAPTPPTAASGAASAAVAAAPGIDVDAVRGAVAESDDDDFDDNDDFDAPVVEEDANDTDDGEGAFSPRVHDPAAAARVPFDDQAT